MQTDLGPNTTARGVSAAVAVAITNFPGQGEILGIIFLYLALEFATLAP